MLDSILAHLDAQRDAVVDLQRSLVAIPALGPDNGGQGERDKADFLEDFLRGLGLTDIRHVDAPDTRVPCGHRPNLAAVLPGEDRGKTLWVISHMDVVPPGDPSLWSGDPYQLRVEGDILYGRGVEDNHQAIVSSVLAARAFLDLGLTPPINLGLLLVSDEETGSKFGLEYVMDKQPDLFAPHDLFLVPDFGTPDSAMVEVSEKSMLWIKLSVHGKQCHASRPDLGVNTLVAASDLVLALAELRERFADRDPLFEPPASTFEPTRKEANVPNVNTIPGLDVFYLDCRVLPRYRLEQVWDAVRSICDQVEQRRGVRVDMEAVQREQAAPGTSPDSEIARKVAAGVRAVYGTEARPQGIGGGTVAAVARRRNFPAVVWATLTQNAHQPDERSLVSFTLGDAKVIAHVLLDRS